MHQAALKFATNEKWVRLRWKCLAVRAFFRNFASDFCVLARAYVFKVKEKSVRKERS